MEGKFANQGLQALDDDDDMLTAMARELVTQKGVGEKADALWKEIQQQHTRLLGTTRVVMEQPQNGLGEAGPWRIAELGQNQVFFGFDSMPGCAMSSSFSFI
jgi:hypothetical protein